MTFNTIKKNKNSVNQRYYIALSSVKTVGALLTIIHKTVTSYIEALALIFRWISEFFISTPERSYIYRTASLSIAKDYV